MSKTDRILDLPVKGIWFDKIASGEKTHEYREYSKWHKISVFRYDKVRFRRGQTIKASDKANTMLFEITGIVIMPGINTDLHIKKPVFDIMLGKRLY